jgi:hypothetical protein
MYYAVTARLIEDQAAAFHRQLTDGTIRAQRPDGQEIVESMERARIDASGVVRWSEICYCPTPLAHERATVYDRFFSDLTTREVDRYVEFDGEPLIERLASLRSAAEAAAR